MKKQPQRTPSGKVTGQRNVPRSTDSLDMLENLPVYVAVLSSDYRVPYANRFFRERFGESHGKRCYEYLFGRTEPCEVCNTFKVLETHAPLQWNWTGPDLRNYHIYDRPFGTVNGLELILEVGIDVTEQTKAEEAIRQSEERYRTFFEADLSADYIKAADGTLLDCNIAFARMFGFVSVEQALKVNMRDLYPDSLKREEFQRAIQKEGKVEKYELEMRRIDGENVSVLENAVGEFDDHGRLLKIRGYIFDITDRKKMEEELRRAGVYNRSLIEASLDPLVTIDANGKLTDVNRATEGLTGFARHELIGTDFCDYFTDPVRARAGYQQVFRDGLVQDYALEVKHRYGRTTPVLYNATIYKNEMGNVAGVFAAARDITKRRHAEENYKRANRSLRTLGKCNEAVVQAQTEHDLLEKICRLIVSEGNYRLAWVGFAESDESKTVRPTASAGFEEGYLESAGITWADTERGRGPTGTAIRTGKPAVCRNIMTDPNFEPWREDAVKRGYASSVVLPLKEGESVFGALCIYSAESEAFDDEEMELLRELADNLSFGITALREHENRRNAEEAFRRANEYNRSLIEASVDPLVTIGPDGKLTDVNSATEQVTGFDRKHLIGTDFSDYFTEPDYARAGYQRVFRVGSVRDYPLEIRHRDGHTTPVLYNASVYRDEQGEVAGVFAAARDITKTREAELKIRQLNSELEERVMQRTVQLEAANKDLEAFAYSVSHDLRAPLRSIDGFAQAILEDYVDTLDDKGKEYFRRIQNSTQRMAQLIDDLLGLSRVTRSEMRLQAVNLSTLADDIAVTLKKDDPRRSVEFVIQPGVVVQGDAALLRIALENLVGNAWKFTSKRPVARIAFGVKLQAGEPAYFVQDDGVGFDMNYADKLFGAFQRLHSMQEFPGTGIGLATVHRVVRRHGGRIWAEGKTGEGATFYFTLSGQLP